MRIVRVRRVLNRHKRRDEWFLDDYSVNPYTGCTFGCLYCYVRGGRYGSTELKVKVNAAEVLRKEITRVERGIVALGTSTEPYMPCEREFEITRDLLKVLAEHRFPVHLLTKSELVLRDADLLLRLERSAILPSDLRLPSRSFVTISFSTIDDELAEVIEPGAPPPSSRMRVVEKLSDLGIHVGAAFIPVIPFLSDSEEDIRRMILEARDRGARYVFVGALTLPGSCKETFFGFLRRRFPELLGRYEILYRGEYPPKWYDRRLEKIARDVCRSLRMKYRIA